MRIVLAVCLLVLIDAKNVCRYPKTWKTYVNLKKADFQFVYIFCSFSQYDFDYKKRPQEWSTTNAKTDYYKLVYSWSPTFCKQLTPSQRSNSFQCQYEDFDFVV